MSTPNLKKAHAIAAARLKLAEDVEAASAALRDIRDRRAATDARISDIERLLTASRLESLLGGDQDAVSEPDLNELTRLRADQKLFPQLEATADRQVTAAINAKSENSSAFHFAVRDCLVDDALNPAINEVYAALEALRSSLVKAMAAHSLVFKDFGSSLQEFRTAADMYGPAANFLQELPKIEWVGHPYSLRPAWAGTYPRHAPYAMEGVQEAKDAAIAHLNARLAKLDEVAA